MRGVSGPSSRRPQGPKKHRRSPTHTRSRLRQVKAEVLALKVSIARGRKECKCTVCEKEFKCRSELWRHMKAHAGEAHGKKWKCCGVPVELAAEYDIARDAKPYIHNGRSMVGGCKTKCGRRDTLQRHLKAKAGICVGNVEKAVALGWLKI